MRNNIKRYLSGLLVGATLLTSAVPAFAATGYTYETQAKALYDLGLFKGVSTETYAPDLGSAMDRQAGVVMMLRLIGEIDAANAMTDSEANAALANYTDASTIETWAKKPVAYAVKNGLVVGTTNTTIGPSEQFIGKMFAAIILRNVGYNISLDNYDNSTSTMVEKGGLTSAEAIKFNDKNLIRDDMVGMSYGSLDLEYAQTAKTIIETLIADGKVNKDLAISLGLYAETVQSMTATQTGAKEFTVKFNKAVDPSKLAVVVKKGTITLNTAEVTAASDNKSITVKMATTITTDDYAITVAGADTAALTANVSAEQSEVAKIEFTSENAVLDRDNAKVVTVGYEVSNQYGEDLTDTADIKFTTGRGTAVGNEGILTITDDSDFEKDDILAVSAIHIDSNTFASKMFTVADKAQVADIQILSLYNDDNKELDIDSNYSDFWLVVNAKDQYGKDVEPAFIADDVIVSVSNKSIVNVSSIFSEESINGEEQTILKLAAPSSPIDGTAKVTIISKTTGKVATYDVVVKDRAEADKISFSNPDFAVAGEKVTVPFTAIDQFGNQITNANKGLTSLTPSFSNSDVTGAFSQDYVKGEPTLTVDATNLTEAESVVMTVVTESGNLAQLTIKFADPAEATIVTGIDEDICKTLLLGDSVEITSDDILIEDQYGREEDFDAANNSLVLSITDESKIDVANETYTLNGSNDTITLNALEKGSSTVSIKILDAEGQVVSGSEYQTTFKVVEKEDIVSYEVSDIAPVYYGGADYAKKVKVYGILSDGSKVAIPYELNGVKNFMVAFPTTTGVAFGADAKFAADNTVKFGTDKDTKDVAVVVTVIGDNGTQVFGKTLTVSKVDPEAAELTIDTNGTNTVETDTLVSADLEAANTQAGLEQVVNSILTVEDQYGVDMTSPVISVIATNLPDGKGFGGTGDAALVEGDSYNVTIVTENGKVLNFVMKLK